MIKIAEMRDDRNHIMEPKEIFLIFKRRYDFFLWQKRSKKLGEKVYYYQKNHCQIHQESDLNKIVESIVLDYCIVTITSTTTSFILFQFSVFAYLVNFHKHSLSQS